MHIFGSSWRAAGVRELNDSCSECSDPPRSALMISVPRYKVNRSYCTTVRLTGRNREQQQKQIGHVFRLEAPASTSSACVVGYSVDDTSH
jgi:hypothetical protein